MKSAAEKLSNLKTLDAHDLVLFQLNPSRPQERKTNFYWHGVDLFSNWCFVKSDD